MTLYFSRRPKSPGSGFTMVELLIALAILGEIATFTIPKLLSAQQSNQKLAAAKEVAGMIAGAYQKAQFAGTVTQNTKPSDLLQYMNYVALDTSGALTDAAPTWAGTAGAGANACDSSTPCVKLYNGGILWFFDSKTFGGTTPLHLIGFSFDPDQVTASGTADGPSKAIQFALYYNGFLTTRGAQKTGSCTSTSCVSNEPDSTKDPSWFRW